MHKICFTISFISCIYMFRAHVLIIRRSKLHYTASGIVTPIGGRLVHETATYRCWLNTVISILRCAVNKTSKFLRLYCVEWYWKMLTDDELPKIEQIGLTGKYCLGMLFGEITGNRKTQQTCSMSPRRNKCLPISVADRENGSP